jgi:hypothetical protein
MEVRGQPGIQSIACIVFVNVAAFKPVGYRTLACIGSPLGAPGYLGGFLLVQHCIEGAQLASTSGPGCV